MSLWLFGENGLCLVDVFRPASLIEAVSHAAKDDLKARWAIVVHRNDRNVLLRSWEFEPDVPPDEQGGENWARIQAGNFLHELASQLNAGNRRPGESPGEVAARLR